MKQILLKLLCLGGLLCSPIILAQITVTGTIADAFDRAALPDLNITEKGTSNNVTSDVNGNYSIDVAEDATLQFSFMGYATQEIAVEGRTLINVSLEKGTEALDELVVTALGITKERKALGYAVSTVSSEELNMVSTPNVMTALYGKAAGVLIKTNPGGPSAGVKVLIRGNNSITGFNQPLFIVDGIPIEHSDSEYGRYGGSDPGNGANDINPEDIESMTILKGANASALYGSKAANGVVVITTKSGDGPERGLGVSFVSSATFEEIAFLPDYQNEYGAGIDSEVFRKNDDGEDILHGVWPSFGPKMKGQQLRWWDGEIRPYSPQPNNIKDIYRPGHTISNTISVSRNIKDKYSFRLSYTNTDYRGTFPGTEQKRNVFSINSKVDFGKKLDVTLVANYYDIVTTNRPNRLGGLAGYEYPRSTKFDLILAKYKEDGYYNGEVSGNKAPGAFRNMMDQIWRANEDKKVDNKGRLIGNITFNYRPFKNFDLRVRIGKDESNVDKTNKSASRRPVNSGVFSINKRKTTLDYGELLATYNGKIIDDLSYTLTVGASISNEKALYTNSSTSGGLVVPNWFSLTNSAGTRTSGGGRYEERTDAIFGVIGFEYKGMLYLDITSRNDWSSTLPPKNNSYFYPSVSASFIFSEVIKNLDWLSYGKFRASYAETGNDAKRYQANKVYKYGTYNGAVTNSFGGNVPPADLKPENQISYEIGVELRLFNNRLGVDFTYYHNQNKDLIMDLAVAPSSSSNGLTTNVGQMDNRGIELELHGTVVRTNSFSWSARGSIAANSNEIISLAAGIDQFPVGDYVGSALKNQARVGQPFGEWVAYTYKRNSAGDKIVDNDGYYVRDDSKYVSMGNSTPDFYGGLSNTLVYKNISLTFHMDFSVGGDIFSFTNYYGLNAGKLKESLKYRNEDQGGLPYYIDASSNIKILLPSHTAASPNGEVVYHDGVIADGKDEDGQQNTAILNSWDYYGGLYYWNYGFHEEGLFDNSYIKVREIALTYQFSKNVIKKLRLQHLSLSFIGRDLFYIYKSVPNIDPESGFGTKSGFASAFEYGGMPSTRSVGISLKVNF